MQKIKLIYNPVSGGRDFPVYLDSFLKKFQSEGFDIRVYRSNCKGDIANGMLDMKQEKYDLLIIAGGDGSVNETVNGMMRNNIDVPLGIIPTGTVNDFASCINMPADIEQCFQIILEQNLRTVDIGRVNERFFINVCAGGLLSQIAHTTNTGLKNKFGRIAYYMNGIRGFSNLKPLPLKITTSSDEIKEKLYLFLILNSKGAGGFNNLVANASINDGLFDFIGIKASISLYDIMLLLLKLFQGEHLENRNVLYLQDNYFKVEPVSVGNYSPCDVDGEKGPHFPLDISLFPGALKVITNFN